MSTSARLLMLEGPSVGQKFNLDAARIVIGRAPQCSVIVAETGVSRVHAAITHSSAGVYEIEDLGSKNGTSVNGIFVRRQVLAFGDKIQIGPRVVMLFSRFHPLEEQLMDRQRLEVLGRMVAGVTHDFNNLLGAILAGTDYLDNLEGKTPLSDAQVRESLADIRLAATNAHELAAGMLAFARGRRSATGAVDISRVCQETVRLIRHTFDQTIRIETSIAPKLAAQGNYSELHQALMNLCLNARDAMKNGGTLRIQADRQLIPDQGGERVVIRVSDDGVGMDAETMSRIFEPFYSTKGSSGGHGLGLAMVKEVISMQGGDVRVKSALGRGTEFSIYLPSAVSRSELRSTGESELPVRLTQRLDSYTIWVVDDEPVVRRSVGRILGQAGFVVCCIQEGREAVELVAKGKVPDLVLLDMDMPGLNGEQTYIRLLELEPTLKVIFGSGGLDPEVETRLRARGIRAFLQKPYSRATMMAAVEDALVERMEADESTRTMVDVRSLTSPIGRR